jgi:hypothetical protein
MRRPAALVLVLASVALAGEPVSSLQGTWVLDLEASSDPTLALQRLGASWLLRKAARVVRATTVITWVDAGRFHLEVRSPIASSTADVVLDGWTPTKSDLLGRPVSYLSRVENDVVVSHGEVWPGSGGALPFESQRFVDAEGRMILRITLRPANEEPLVVTRVSRRR